MTSSTKTSMAIKIIYHACIVKDKPRGIPIVQEHLQAILMSGLYDACDSIHLYIATDHDIQSISSFAERYGRKINVHICNTLWKERDTLMDAFSKIREEDFVLYLHSKGITRFGFEASTVDDWRNMMNYFLIRHYATCVKKLEEDGYDVVGVNYEPLPAPHFSGNFWWVRGDYFLGLPRFIGTNIYDVELLFLFVNRPRHFNMYHSHTHHYQALYPPSAYVDGDAEST